MHPLTLQILLGVVAAEEPRTPTLAGPAGSGCSVSDCPLYFVLSVTVESWARSGYWLGSWQSPEMLQATSAPEAGVVG